MDRLLRLSRIRQRFFPSLLRLVDRLPVAFSSAGLSGAAAVFRAAPVQGAVRLLDACRQVSTLQAVVLGEAQAPTEIAAKWVKAMERCAADYIHLYKSTERVQPRLRMSTEFRELAQLASSRGGILLAVPHSHCGVLAAIRLSREAPTVLHLGRTRRGSHGEAVRSFFDRLNLCTVADRPVSRRQLATQCINHLRRGKILVVTVDSPTRRAGSVELRQWGAPWRISTAAARLARIADRPIVPCYPFLDGDQIRTPWAGEVNPTDETRAARLCYRRLMDLVLAEPASWTSLMDRRWRNLLRQAAMKKAN